jgi:Mn2+/Fe2+ NRAMP family transporter
MFWSAVINGLVAIPVMAMMKFVGSNKNIIDKFALKGVLRNVNWLATGLWRAPCSCNGVTAIL